MRKRWALALIVLASLSLAGCAAGDAWYYPYGPCYFDGDERAPPTVNAFLSQQRPE